MNLRFDSLEILHLAADLQGDQASAFKRREIHLNAFGDLECFSQPGDQAGSPTLAQQGGEQIGSHHPILIRGLWSWPKHHEPSSFEAVDGEFMASWP